MNDLEWILPLIDRILCAVAAGGVYAVCRLDFNGLQFNIYPNVPEEGEKNADLIL